MSSDWLVCLSIYHVTFTSTFCFLNSASSTELALYEASITCKGVYGKMKTYYSLYHPQYNSREVTCVTVMLDDLPSELGLRLGVHVGFHRQYSENKKRVVIAALT